MEWRPGELWGYQMNGVQVQFVSIGGTAVLPVAHFGRNLDSLPLPHGLHSVIYQTPPACTVSRESSTLYIALAGCHNFSAGPWHEASRGSPVTPRPHGQLHPQSTTLIMALPCSETLPDPNGLAKQPPWQLQV